MGSYLDNFNSSIGSALEVFMGIFHSVPGAMFVLLIPVGLAHLFFGLRIYKIILAFLCFIVGTLTAYYLSHNSVIAGVAGAGLAVFSLILHFIFVLICVGITFGIAAFAGMMAYFRYHVSLLVSILSTVIGIFAAIKIYRFIIIFTTSVIGSAAVTFSVLVLKEQRRIFKPVDLTELEIDIFQMTIGFCTLLILGIVIQSITWGRSGKDN